MSIDKPDMRTELRWRGGRYRNPADRTWCIEYAKQTGDHDFPAYQEVYARVGNKRKRGGARKVKSEVRGRYRVLWHVRGETFESKSAAAAQHGVTPKTIMRWCKGNSSTGAEPRKDCWCEED